VQGLVQRSPQLAGLDRSRWWLDGLRQQVAWLADCSLSGVQRVLKRLGVVYKRGQEYIHSPDPDYDLKLAYITAARRLATQQPERFVVLYLDELTYYRIPTRAQGYAQRGSSAPRVASGYKRNRMRRVVAALDAQTGRLIAWQRSHFPHPVLLAFYQAIAQMYPKAERIFLVMDNWAAHFHPDILLALADSRVTLLRTPTYAPWTNPVEKVWRYLHQEVLHLHPFGDDWRGLQQAVERWLAKWTLPSPDLLRYVGLLPA